LQKVLVIIIEYPRKHVTLFDRTLTLFGRTRADQKSFRPNRPHWIFWMPLLDCDTDLTIRMQSTKHSQIITCSVRRLRQLSHAFEDFKATTTTRGYKENPDDHHDERLLLDCPTDRARKFASGIPIDILTILAA
jgi:hypothetical protein